MREKVRPASIMIFSVFIAFGIFSDCRSTASAVVQRAPSGTDARWDSNDGATATRQITKQNTCQRTGGHSETATAFRTGDGDREGKRHVTYFVGS